MAWNDIYKDFYTLSENEQLELFRAIKKDLFPKPKSDISKMVGDVRETRFSKGLAYIYCGSMSVKRNGKYRSRQRYFCKDCGKSFNEMTGVATRSHQCKQKGIQKEGNLSHSTRQWVS
jgi:hypothetical protein